MSTIHKILQNIHRVDSEIAHYATLSTAVDAKILAQINAPQLSSVYLAFAVHLLDIKESINMTTKIKQIQNHNLLTTIHSMLYTETMQPLQPFSSCNWTICPNRYIPIVVLQTTNPAVPSRLMVPPNDPVLNHEFVPFHHRRSRVLNFEELQCDLI